MNLAEALSRIEQQQLEQQKLLKRLVKQSHQLEAATSTVTSQLTPSPDFETETSSSTSTSTSSSLSSSTSSLSADSVIIEYHRFFAWL